MSVTARVASAYGAASIATAVIAYSTDVPVARAIGRALLLLLAGMAVLWAAKRAQDQMSRSGWGWVSTHYTLAAIAAAGWGFSALDGSILPKPSWADAIYFLSYIALLIGVLRVVRGVGGGGRTDAVDASVAAVAIGVISWTFLLRGAVPGSGVEATQLVTAAIYPFFDLVILAVAGRLWFITAGPNARPYRLVVLGLAMNLLADTAYAALVISGEFRNGLVLGLGWLTGTALVAIGAITAPPDPHQLPSPPHRHSIGRVVALLSLGVLLPVLVALESIGAYDVQHAVVVTLLVGVGFTLAIWRVRGLADGFGSALHRERLLGEAGSRLVAAPDRAGIAAILLETVSRLAGHPAPVWLLQTAGKSAVVSASTRDASGQVLSQAVIADLTDGFVGGQRVVRGPSAAHDALSVSPDLVLLSVWITDGTDPGVFVVVAMPEVPEAWLVPAISSVTENARMALDRIALNRKIVDQQSVARLEQMLEQASDIIAVVGSDDRLTYASPAVQAVLGLSPGMVTGVAFADLLADEHRSQITDVLSAAREGATSEIEVRAITTGGESRILHVVVSRVDDSGSPELVLTCHDVTERHALTRQLQHQAFHDPLTGLANRELLADRMNQAAARTRRTGRINGVIMLDLDDFKTVNDSLGHAAGDALIVEIAGRISSCLRGQDTAARLGGDEFAVLLEDLTGEAEAMRVAQRLVAACAEPAFAGGQSVVVAASAGVVLDDGSGDVPDLLRNADLALYAAKADGKGTARRYEPAMHRAAVRRLELTADLRRAVSRNEFVPHFQPTVRLDGGRVVSLEALARWEHPQRGLLKPSEFLELAEETRLAVPMGRALIESTLGSFAQWQAVVDGAEHLRLAINLGPKELGPDGLTRDLIAAAMAHGVGPEQILLEVSESTFATEAELVQPSLRRLADAGFGVYVDDFGSGHASLALLRRLPITGLKLAPQLVHALPLGGADAHMVDSLLQVALGMDLEAVVAEGVETEEQAAALRAMGFEVAQGYLLSKPVPAEQVPELLTERGIARPVQRARQP